MLRALKQKLRVRTRIVEFLRYSKALGRFRIDHVARVEQADGQTIQNVKILWPAQSKVSLTPTDNERQFLKVCKYFNDGFHARENIFVAEVPGAYCQIGTGLVCTSDFKAVSESQMEYRLGAIPAFRWFKPTRARRLPGTYATIQNIFATYWWHWLVDCLPRIYSLYATYPGQKITLLAPADLGTTFKESLAAVLPENFEVQTLPADSWVNVDRLLLAGYASARANGHLPVEYFAFMRQNVFARYTLPTQNEPRERLYISRALAKVRRPRNEDQLSALLLRFGFKPVFLEKLDFRQQVELFHRAEVIAGPYGSAWGNLIWAGKIKVLILYPDRPPETHAFTLAKALEQEHYFWAGNESSPNADFTVDLAAVERVLLHEMGLEPIPAAASTPATEPAGLTQ
jgi:capsular polysaccharide biosynthesis protein